MTEDLTTILRAWAIVMGNAKLVDMLDAKLTVYDYMNDAENGIRAQRHKANTELLALNQGKLPGIPKDQIPNVRPLIQKRLDDMDKTLEMIGKWRKEYGATKV